MIAPQVTTLSPDQLSLLFWGKAGADFCQQCRVGSRFAIFNSWAHWWVSELLCLVLGWREEDGWQQNTACVKCPTLASSKKMSSLFTFTSIQKISQPAKHFLLSLGKPWDRAHCLSTGVWSGTEFCLADSMEDPGQRGHQSTKEIWLMSKCQQEWMGTLINDFCPVLKKGSLTPSSLFLWKKIGVGWGTERKKGEKTLL